MRRAKTDKKDAIKPANDGLGHWLILARYRYLIDAQKLLPGNTSRIQKLKNNLISLLDTAFLGASRLFSSPPRADGSEKWVDFVAAFWHCACVCGLSEKAFISKYQNGIIRYQSWYSIGLSSYINSPSLISTSKNCRSVSFLSSTHTLIWRISSDVSTTGGIMLRGTP